MENSELLERFLPGYRIVCRITARYLGIDLTKWATLMFVLFALLKSVQYLWTSVSGPLATWLTSSIAVSADERLHDDVLAWVAVNVVGEHTFASGAGARTLMVASSGRWDWRDRDRTGGVDGEGMGKKDERLSSARPRPGEKAGGRLAFPIRYEPAFNSTMWFFRGWRVVFLRRQRSPVGGKSGHEDVITLSCIGLTAEPLRRFLEECMERADAEKTADCGAPDHSIGMLRVRQKGAVRENGTNQKEE